MKLFVLLVFALSFCVGFAALAHDGHDHGGAPAYDAVYALGDVNLDARVNICDLVLLSQAAAGGHHSIAVSLLPCPRTGDVNRDRGICPCDVVTLARALYMGEKLEGRVDCAPSAQGY